jgi:hypothetical protein
LQACCALHPLKNKYAMGLGDRVAHRMCGHGCLATAVCYTPQGTVYGISLGQTSTFTGFNITNSYSTRLLPQEFKASSSAGNAIGITYSFTDPVKGGNAGHVFSVTNNLNASRSQSFTYDQVNRILSAGTSAKYWLRGSRNI